MTNKEYVRSRWVDCAVEDHRACCGVDEWRFVIADSYSKWAASEFGAWFAAAEFTHQHEKKIEDVEEEIAEVQHWLERKPVNANVIERILAREQSALAELKKGWKA